jgi:hypothetical protein
MYGAPPEAAELAWPWVEQQLVDAGTYWLVAPADGHPHPRPVWGVWHEATLLLSIGSPVLARQVGERPDVTVHLDSGTDVVVVEGEVHLLDISDHAPAIAAYDAKYDWRYSIDEYGPLTTVQPRRVLAWRSAGWAGREGFREAGSWRFG